MRKLVRIPRVKTFARLCPSIYGDVTRLRLGVKSFSGQLMRKADTTGANKGVSRQGVCLGTQSIPFDMEIARELQLVNAHHSRCLTVKINSTVGLGFASDNVSTKLDELCRDSFLSTLRTVAADYYNTANGYLEVVKDASGAIVGLFRVASTQVEIYVEDEKRNFHYVVTGEDGQPRRFARIGDLQGFRERAGLGAQNFNSDAVLDEDHVSEIIHFPGALDLNDWYGYPDWFAAVPAIELICKKRQHRSDFYSNRGVPEFILAVTGKKLSGKDYDKLEEILKSHVGLGNQYKSSLVNLDGANVKVDVIKLAMESKGGGDDGTEMQDAALEIVSVHGVPPLLAGIVIPGKLGAANELPQAMVGFQNLTVGPVQEHFQTILGVTLGDSLNAPGLGLTKKDFVLKKITETTDLAALNTTSLMRDPLGSPQAAGRNPQDGLLRDGRKDGQGGRVNGS